MRRVAIEARCRVFLARIALRRGRAAEARRIVEAMAAERQGNLPPELRAQLRYALSRALAAGGDPEGAKGEEAAAQRDLMAAADLAGERYRDTVLARMDFRFTW
jgi:hypothetical protein